MSAGERERHPDAVEASGGAPTSCDGCSLCRAMRAAPCEHVWSDEMHRVIGPLGGPCWSAVCVRCGVSAADADVYGV